MHVGMIGINHFSSSLAQREQVAKVCHEKFSPFGCHPTYSHVLLSTCNRTELYFSSPSLTATHSDLLHELRESVQEPVDQVLYSYFGEECFLHLARVISGMDSLIYGESDIQRQVKLAYETMRQRRALTPSLHYLFQKGLKIGKEMRTAFLSSQMQLPVAIWNLLKELKGACTQKPILFVGNSLINRSILSYFLHQGCQKLQLCSRTEKTPFPFVPLVSWNTLDRWDEYEIVIAGTYHPGYVIPHSARKNDKNLVLFDLGVPRNIDPQLALHPQTYLYNIDDLSRLAGKRKKTSEKEIQLCEARVEKIVARQMQLFHKKQQAKWRYTSSCEKLSLLHSSC